MVFPVVMYGHESWTIKQAECRRIDAFELWCWRRFLRIPWTSRRSNQSILKEISPEYSLKDWCWSWNSSTLATWYKELTHLKRSWCGERLKAGGEGDNRGWEGWMAWLDGHEFEQAPGVGDGQGSLACCSPWGRKESDTTERLNWTQGDGGDGQDREGILGEVALTLRTARWAWVRRREKFPCKRCSLCNYTLSVVQSARLSAAGTESGDPRGTGEWGGKGVSSWSWLIMWLHYSLLPSFVVHVLGTRRVWGTVLGTG